MTEIREKKLNMEELVYEKLKNAIYKRFIRPNSQLVESAIAEQLGVSRTPVRAAIKKLVYQGFVQLHPNKGAFVIKPTIAEIKQTFEVRVQLEEMSASLAAINITGVELEYLKNLIEEEKKIFQKRDLDNYYKFNDEFHLKIAETSGNKILIQYVGDIISKTNIYLILFDPFYQMLINPSIEEHLMIVEALQSKTSDKAKEAIKIHLNSALKGMNLEEVEENMPQDYLFV